MFDQPTKVEDLPSHWHGAVRWLIDNFAPDQLVCILVYGSALFGKTHTELSDIDTTIVLREPRETDAAVLFHAREICPKLDLTFQYLCEIQSAPADHFQFGNHGAFYAPILASTMTFYGENPYIKLAGRVSSAAVRRSLRRQIREHLFRIRQKQITAGPESVAFVTFARKYLLRVIQNIYYIEFGVHVEEFKHKPWLEWLSVIRRSSILSHGTLALAQDVYSTATPSPQECDVLLRRVAEEIRKWNS